MDTQPAQVSIPTEPKIQNFDQSPEISKLFEALSKAQAEMRPAVMDMKNPHFNSKYASLTSCQDAYRAPLAKHGLCFTQQIFSIKDVFYIRSMLGHVSGQWISNIFKLITDKQNMQGLGSAITYGRRYGVNALIGIVDTEDDDGNAATGKPSPDDDHKAGKQAEKGTAMSPRPPQQSAQGLYKDGKQVDTSRGHDKPLDLDIRPLSSVPPIDPKKVTGPQLNRLNAIANSKKWSHDQVKQYAKAFCNVDSTKDLGRREYDILVKVIEASTFETAMKELK